MRRSIATAEERSPSRPTSGVTAAGRFVGCVWEGGNQCAAGSVPGCSMVPFHLRRIVPLSIRQLAFTDYRDSMRSESPPVTFEGDRRTVAIVYLWPLGVIRKITYY